MPRGDAVLFTIVSGGPDPVHVAVLDRRTGKHTVVVRGGSHARYVRSGHIVYAAANALRAVGFDSDTLTTQGTPVPVVSEVVTASTGGLDGSAPFAV